jgi:hypothetical protein
MATLLGQTRRPFGRPAYQYVRTTDKLPSTDEANAQADPVCKVKLFSPEGRATWYLAGFDPETGRAFGVATIFETEVGDFDVNELVAVRTPLFRLPIERDLYWTPAPVSAVLAGTVR